MKAEILNPFIKAASNVIQQNICEVPTKGKPYITQNYPYHSLPIGVFIGVIGKIKGTLILTMSMATALGIAGKMMMEEISVLDESARSAIGELGNMIAANATIEIANTGRPCNITPPSIISGDNVEITPGNTNIPTLVLPMGTSLGEIELHIAVEEIP